MAKDIRKTKLLSALDNNSTTTIKEILKQDPHLINDHDVAVAYAHGFPSSDTRELFEQAKQAIEAGTANTNITHGNFGGKPPSIEPDGKG